MSELGKSETVGHGIKAAMDRAEQHEIVAPRKLRVMLRCHYGEGHHAPGLVIAARYAARNEHELTAQSVESGCIMLVPWDDLDAHSRWLSQYVDECVAAAGRAIGLDEAAT